MIETMLDQTTSQYSFSDDNSAFSQHKRAHYVIKNVNLHDHARFISDLGDFTYVKYTSEYTSIR